VTEALGRVVQTARRAHEVAHADHLALINAAAAKLWPGGESPIGKRIRVDFLGKAPGPQVLLSPGANPYVTVVGIIGNTKNAGIKDVRMYFGSWNEWSRDPSLPIEEGLPTEVRLTEKAA